MEKTISRNDKIFATLSHNGTVIAGINGNNFGSIADVISHIFEAAGRWLGVAVLSIRNYNQGWRMDMPITLKPRRKVQRNNAVQPHDGRQYVLPLFS